MGVMDGIGLFIFFLIFLTVAVRFVRCIRLVPNRKKFIVERLGKYHQTLEPGFHVLIPFVDRVAFIQDLREESIEVPPQECFTKDNVKVEVDGVLYISIQNAEKASYGVTDYRTAAILLAQTTTRSVIGKLDLDRTFEERDEINREVLSTLDEVAETWGIQVHRYEIKNIVPPNTVRNAMERQMAAERQRRALLARSEGEKMSLINDSEGAKAELINTSEGEMHRRINEAEGRAEEILSIAEATAESIMKLGAALAQKGGAEAVRLRLSQGYLTQLRTLGRRNTKVLLPANISAVDELLKSVGLDADAAEAEAKALEAEAARLPPREKRAPRVRREAARAARLTTAVPPPKPKPSAAEAVPAMAPPTAEPVAAGIEDS